MDLIGGRKVAERLVSHAWTSSFMNTVLNVLLNATGRDAEWFEAHGITCRGALDGQSVFMATEALDDDILEATYWIDIFAINLHETDPRRWVPRVVDIIRR